MVTLQYTNYYGKLSLIQFSFMMLQCENDLLMNWVIYEVGGRIIVV